MNKTAKNSVIYLAGTIIMGVLGLVSTMVLTRFLSQKVYAMYGLLMTFHTVINMLVALGFDSSYMRFYYNHAYSQKAYMLMCIKYPLILFGVTTLLLIEPGQYIIQLIFKEKLSAIALAALVVYFLFSFLHRFSQLVARMEEHAGNYVLSNMVGKSGFIVLLLTVYALWSEVSFEWVVISFALTSMIALLINMTLFGKINRPIKTDGNAVTEKQLFQYGYPLMINNVIILVIPMIEKVIIRDLAGWETLSLYTAAAVFQTVVLIVVNTLTNIWNPLVFKHCDNEKMFKPLLHQFGLIGTVLLVLGTAACILLRRWLVLLLDESYVEVFVIAPTILLSACFNIVSLIYSVGINIKHKTKYQIVSPIIQLAISLVLCYTLVPEMGLIGAALAVLISVGAGHMYKIVVGLKLYNTGEKEGKVIALIICTIAVALTSLFATTLLADVVMSLVLCTLLLVIGNKEIKPTVQFALSMVHPAKKEKVSEPEKGGTL